MDQTEDQLTEVMQVATEAGHIMLENGAEIFRVPNTWRYAPVAQTGENNK